MEVKKRNRHLGIIILIGFFINYWRNYFLYCYKL